MAVTVARRPDRVQTALLASLLGIAVVAWILTHDRMVGMDAGPGTDLGGLGFYVVSWVVMMSAMMFPSIAPMVLTFAMVQRRRRERGAVEEAVSTWLFVAVYLAVWALFGLLAYGVFVGVRSLSIGAFSWHRGGRYVAGVVIVVAAIYQLTPYKDVCLRRCRSPLQFLATEWQEGTWGTVRMGALHGAWCVGCCWGLMAALFALGVMSIAWMVVVAAMIAFEKLLPWKALANRAIAATLVVLGLGLAFSPHDVPGLTLPNSPAAARAMQSMSGMHMKGDSMSGRRMTGKSISGMHMNGSGSGKPAPTR